jgi:hypothetical protein
MPVRGPAGLAISMSGCSAESLEPGHLVLAGRRHDVHSGSVSCHCRDRSTVGSPATRERTRSGRTRLSIPWCETLSGLESAQPRAPPGAAAGVGRMRRSLPTLRGRRVSSRPGRPGRCARRSDRPEAAEYVDSGPGGARRSSGPACRSPRSAAALTCPVRTAAELRRLAMEPDQLAGEQCLNAERPVHEHPPISGGRPASRPRCATGAYCDIRRSVLEWSLRSGMLAQRRSV